MKKLYDHIFVIFYTKEKQKKEIFFGDYQPFEELSAMFWIL